MGTSEHYCLRWNNHQNNLLGVFSQLLRDESLVDVTLACSEGHSIRAHRVVLSACSSYFQTLFVDHPSRHPIVILKDVRFAELRTLIEFMYRGEVNVEYCQLSALLKTAESLKVKGLAEMTNLSSTGCTNTNSSSAAAAASAPPPSATITSQQHDNIASAPHEQRVLLEQQREHLNRELHDPLRLDRDQIKSEPLDTHHRISSAGGTTDEGSANTPTPPPRRQCNSASPPPPPHRRTVMLLSQQQQDLQDDTGGGESPPRPPDDHHESVVNLTCPSDLSVQQTNNNNTSGSGPSSSSNRMAPISPHHHDTEPIAGPSGLPPVQQVPLSLKKEVDWGGGMADDKSTIETDYSRHPYEQEMLTMEGTSSSFPCMYCGATFPHQSKLTRHILSHSLETLKYRESQTQSLLGLPPGLPPDIVFRAHEPQPPMDPAGSSTAEHQMETDYDTSGNVGSGVLCKFCGKSFPDVGSLIAHLPAHTGDRPFKCEFCGKAFKLRHHMKDHCRVHTGERPFRCSLCGKTFSRSTILKAHEKTHYPKYVRKFLSPSPLDTEEESNPHQ